MKEKLFKYLFFIIAIVIVISACVFVFINKEGKKEIVQESNKKISINKEIRIGISGFDTLNPVLTKNLDIQYLSRLIYRGLLSVTKDFKIENDLAEDYSKLNDKAYIIKLKEEIYWHNGEILDAEDVKFTIDNLKKIDSIYSENVKHIIDVEILDSYTIKIYLDDEVPFFEYLLTFPILNKDYYSENTLESKLEIPIGSGDFKIASIKEDEIILESKQTKLIISIYDDMSKAYLDLEKENIDLLNTKNIEYEKYTGKLGINSNISSSREFDYIAINNENNLLKNVEVRKTLNYFIDRKKIIYEIFNNKYYQIVFPINAESYLYNGEGDSYDINEGKKILIENGWQLKNNVWQKNGEKLEFYLLVNMNNKKRCEVAKLIKEELKENGIIINIIEANDYYFSQKLKHGNYDLALTGTILPIYPNIETYFGKDNINNYFNEEVLSILEDIKNIKNENLLKEKYNRVQQIYNEDMPFICLYIDTNFLLYNSNLRGDFYHNWYNLYYNINNWYKEE